MPDWSPEPRGAVEGDGVFRHIASVIVAIVLSANITALLQNHTVMRDGATWYPDIFLRRGEYVLGTNQVLIQCLP